MRIKNKFNVLNESLKIKIGRKKNQMKVRREN